MNIKTRLAALESKPTPPRVVHPPNPDQSAESKASRRNFVLSLQRTLNLPLPATCPPEERAESLRLFRAAIAAIRHDSTDQKMLGQFRQHNAYLHRKYGRPPTDAN